jgi:hypothetical protein
MEFIVHFIHICWCSQFTDTSSFFADSILIYTYIFCVCVQHYNTTERYYEKVLENTTRVYDEVNNVWVNITKNYTVSGNWTRIVPHTVTISGTGQPVDAVISPDGKSYYIVTGYFSTVTTYGGYACTTASNTNDCVNQRGYITTFKRDPSDGTLLWKASLR